MSKYFIKRLNSSLNHLYICPWDDGSGTVGEFDLEDAYGGLGFYLLRSKGERLDFANLSKVGCTHDPYLVSYLHASTDGLIQFFPRCLTCRVMWYNDLGSYHTCPNLGSAVNGGLGACTGF